MYSYAGPSCPHGQTRDIHAEFIQNRFFFYQNMFKLYAVRILHTFSMSVLHEKSPFSQT